MLKKLLLLAVIGVSYEASAQTNFRPGYVVTLGGDTLRGVVDYRDDRLNAQRCRFKLTDGATVQEFQPAGLRGYGFWGKQKYHSHLVTMPSDTLQPPEAYFLEVLVMGPARLYYLRDARQNEHYYVATAAMPVTELVQRTIKTEREGHTYLEQQSPFRQVLAAAFQGCSSVQSDLPQLRLQSKSLVRVVAQYNTACSSNAGAAEATPLSAQPKTTISFGLLAGGQLSRVSVESAISMRVIKLQSTDITAGLAFGVQGSRLRKISLRAYALYRPQRYDSEISSAFRGTYAEKSLVNIKIHHLHVPVMLRYTYPRGRVRPFVEFGVSGYLALKEENSIVDVYASGNYSKPRPFIYPNSFRPVEVGLASGVGLAFPVAGRSGAFLLHADTSNGFIGTIGESARTKYFSALLSFDLTKIPMEK